MDIQAYKEKYQEEGAPGWDAIDAALLPIYGEQQPLTHWGTILKHMLGGEDPIDGISVYASEAGGSPHWHFITYGFSSLYYDEESLGKDFSKFGFELTFRLKPRNGWEVETDSKWAVSLLQNIAKYVFSSGNWFEPFHWMPANGPIKLNDDTLIHGLIFIVDPQLPEIMTPHGRVQFLQLVGVTEKEINMIRDKQIDAATIIDRLKQNNPLLICDLDRQISVV
ncbi:suppressor of fused domain protein [Chitinophaga pendula]|uniref:suppressor of fused domain protein n=1 Tax=Chitinophaga TaxID=79328 RepID=UPI000BAEEED3|nr:MULTISPECIES: suppressor of fused domain protein [Chitinophaga]ASZ11235.1 riboflavin biosynthesis protein [Chitinophaga sp. MD30]UCJ05768.1 suppressor of fused domain protein [Chitinophaga pendula]